MPDKCPKLLPVKPLIPGKWHFFITDKRSKAGVKTFKVINPCFFYTR
ncbi:MAG: hypothetical protein JWQ34_1998 [Mucilaginibacter sp.]|nr:hypothetical protein [Mucilaginibacter sp.]